MHKLWGTLIITLLFCGNAVAQNHDMPPADSSFTCSFPDIPAQFPGGDIALLKFISANLNYPDSANKNDIQGTVRVQFVVEKDGSISNVIVKNSLGYGVGEEAIRLIKSMPRWKPASVNGKAVKMKYQIPVKFVLK